MSQTYGCSLLWTKSLTCIGSFSMDAVTQMCYVFFHLFFNVSPIQKWVWVRWLHIGTGDNYARHTVLWFRRSSRKVKGVEVVIKEERNVSYATACTARNPLLHWQKCQGCYFLCLVGNCDGLLTSLKECAVLGKCPSKRCVLSHFSWHLPAVFHCDYLRQLDELKPSPPPCPCSKRDSKANPFLHPAGQLCNCISSPAATQPTSALQLVFTS